MPRALCSIGHSGARLERCSLDLGFLSSPRYSDNPISPALLPLCELTSLPWRESFLILYPRAISLARDQNSVTTAQSWPTCPPPEDSRSHGGFKLHLRMWDEPPEVSSICLNLRECSAGAWDAANPNVSARNKCWSSYIKCVKPPSFSRNKQNYFVRS